MSRCRDVARVNEIRMVSRFRVGPNHIPSPLLSRNSPPQVIGGGWSGRIYDTVRIREVFAGSL